MEGTAFPLKSEYTLTESGLEMIDVIKGMKLWALRWKIKNIECNMRALLSLKLVVMLQIFPLDL